MPPLVLLDGVSKEYRSDGVVTVALRPTNLTIHRQEFVCVAGPSGSGKTTLLNLIGVIDRPTSGRLVVAGQECNRLSRAQAARLRRARIGFVFQALNLIPVLSAYENIEYILLLQGVPARERGQRVRQALAEVGLAGLGHKRPGQLSGGQQQRVAVARAIVARPELVVADEPTGSLDSHTGEALLGLLARINRQHGTTFVFSSHDPAMIRRAGRVLTLRDGRLEQDRPGAVLA